MSKLRPQKTLLPTEQGFEPGQNRFRKLLPAANAGSWAECPAEAVSQESPAAAEGASSASLAPAFGDDNGKSKSTTTALMASLKQRAKNGLAEAGGTGATAVNIIGSARFLRGYRGRLASGHGGN